MTRLGRLDVYDTRITVELLPMGGITVSQLEKLLRAAQAAQQAIQQPVSLPAEEGAAEDSRPVAAAPSLIDAPVSPPAAGEVEDAKPETGTGTPAPVVDPSSPPPTDSSVCAGCGQEFATPGRVGQHKRFCKGRPIAAAVPETANGKDAREIHEDCPKCGRPFTWAPSLANHVATCRGVTAGSNRGGIGE